MSLIKGVVRNQSRRNADKSLTFYARWQTWNDERTELFQHMERLFRTEAKCKGKPLRDAKARARQMCNEIFQHTKYPDDRHAIRPMATLDAVKMYMLWARASNSEYDPPMAESTADRQEQSLMDFINFVCDFRPRVRQAHKLLNWHACEWARVKMNAGLSPHTVLTKLSDLQGWLDFCVEQDWMERPLVLKRLRGRIRKSLQREPTRVIPTTARINGAIAAQGDFIMRAAMFTLAATGLRSGELRALIRSNVDVHGKLLKVNRTEREGFTTATKRHERVMPYGDVLGAILYDILPTRTGPWLFGTAEGYKQLGSQLNHKLKPLALKPHDFRRWFCSTLENMECEGYILADLLGHVMDKTRRAYSSGVDVDLRRKWMIRVEAQLVWPH